MFIAFALTFALLTAPVAFLKRGNLDPSQRSLSDMLDYMVKKVTWTAVLVGLVVVASIFVFVTIAEGNPTVYVGPMITFAANTVVATAAGIMVPWLVVLGAQILRDRRPNRAH